MIKELAITATVGVALTILTDLVLLPVLLSYTVVRNIDKKREYRLRQLTQFDKVWAFLAKLARPVPALVVIAIGAVVWFFAWQEGNKVMIGDAQAGVAELRPEARYNQDAVLISKKFKLGVDILNVIAEAGRRRARPATRRWRPSTASPGTWPTSRASSRCSRCPRPPRSSTPAGTTVRSAGACCRATRTRCARPRRASRPTRACSTPTAARSR
jgi:hypothetical protein